MTGRADSWWWTRYAIVFLCGISGCAYGTKAIPNEIKEGIAPGLTIRAVIRNPEMAIGKKVLWGGVILKTIPYREGTRLEILQRPLDRRERPIETDESHGRFFVEEPGRFLDPAVFKEGREITIVGEIRGERREIIGEMEYRYPDIVATFIHLWKRRPIYISRDYPVYPFTYWFGPYPYAIYPGYLYPFPTWYGDPFLFPGHPLRRIPHHPHDRMSSAKPF